MDAAPAPGFADPTMEAQAAFRAILTAMAGPGRIVELAPPAGLAATPDGGRPIPPGLAAVLLVLADRTTPVFLDDALSTDAMRRFLAFHTGAPRATGPDTAVLAAISSPEHLPDPAAFPAGSDAHPETSATVIVAVDRLAAGDGLALTGPGIDGCARLLIEPMPAWLPAALAANHARFPRGVDFLFVTDRTAAALPRSTAVAA